MKRILSVLVVLMLILTMVPAMAEEGTIKRQENGLPDLEGRLITIWYRNRQNGVTDDLTNMHNVQKLEEMVNCEFKFIHPPEDQVAEHFAIMMAEDKLPDMIFCKGIDNYYPGGLAAAYEDGVLYDYTDLINETNTPNFWNVMMNDDYLAPLMKDDSGRIVRLGAKLQGSATCDFWYQGNTIRQDILEALGKEVPVTIADWYDVLTAMKDYGIQYPLIANKSYMLTKFALAYGLVQDDFYIGTDGNVHYGPYEPALKDFLTEMNKWYTEGLVNPDFMTLDEGDGTALMLDNKGGAMSTHVWQWPFNFNENNTNEEAVLVAAPYAKLNADDEMNLRYSSRSMDDFKYITVDAEDPLACVMLLDVLYIPEISYMMGDGMEGKRWEYGELGIPVSYEKDDPRRSEDDLDGGISEWHMYEDNDARNLDTKWTEPAADGIRLWGEAGTSQRLPGNGRFLMFTTEESEVRANVQTDIKTYADEMCLKFITGQESLDNFDAYIAQLKAMGVEDLIATEQAAYERLEARR